MDWTNILKFITNNTFVRRSCWPKNEKAYFKSFDCKVKLIREDNNGSRKSITKTDLDARDWEIYTSSF